MVNPSAERSGCFDSIIVSTDDLRLLLLLVSMEQRSHSLGLLNLQVITPRRSQLVKHAISWFDSNSLQFDYICCLYATAPFVQPSELSLGRDHLIASRSNTVVFSATSYPFPIQRAVRIPEWLLVHVSADLFGSRVDLEEAYHDAGQFYWATPDTCLVPLTF